MIFSILIRPSLRKLLFLLCFVIDVALAGTRLPFYTENNRHIVQNEQQPVFAIQLKSNPTTGYSWELKPYDTHYIELLDHHYTPVNQKHLLGAESIDQWVFRLKKPAFLSPRLLMLNFVYRRPWETTTTPSTLTFQITSETDKDQPTLSNRG